MSSICLQLRPCLQGRRGAWGRSGDKSGCGALARRVGVVSPVIVRAHIPEEVEGKLAGLLLAVELVALLSLPQLVSKGVAQFVLSHVLFQPMQALDDLGIRLKAGALRPLTAAPLVAALLMDPLKFSEHSMTTAKWKLDDV